MTSAPSPFSPSLPTFQVAWDSTSLSWFKRCARRYQYHMLEGWQSRGKGIHLYFGGLYASGVELYARLRSKGQSHDDAVLAVIAWALEASGEFGPDETDAMSDTRGLEVWHAWESNDPYKNRYTLLRTLVWNLDDRDESPWRTVQLANGQPAVELSFNFPAFEVAGHTISLSGHGDSIVENAGQKWWLDDKTTKSDLNAQYFAQYTPGNQMSLYAVAGSVVLGAPVSGVLVRAAQIQVHGSKFATQQVPRSKPVLDEWLADTQRWVELAHSYAVAGHWPMNDTSCGDYGGCPFRKVCSVSPSHRQSWLEADFERRNWNPLEARGE